MIYPPKKSLHYVEKFNARSFSTYFFVQSLASSWLAKRNALSAKVTPLEESFDVFPELITGMLSEIFNIQIY